MVAYTFFVTARYLGVIKSNRCYFCFVIFCIGQIYHVSVYFVPRGTLGTRGNKIFGNRSYLFVEAIFWYLFYFKFIYFIFYIFWKDKFLCCGNFRIFSFLTSWVFIKSISSLIFNVIVKFFTLVYFHMIY